MDEEIFRVSKNENRASSLVEMAKERYSDLKDEDKPYKIVEEYYEIIKELITALMYLNGYKTLSHKTLVSYLEKNYKDFDKSEIILIDELRKLRNNIVYYGQKVEKEFITNNKKELDKIIEKLFKILNSLL
ncbi:hypothetical protein J4221_00995 [Candidatus Pacearchaeota archaeon]|nr:hypothetical protein [Candidatus Pacearchaeota archaeon]